MRNIVGYLKRQDVKMDMCPICNGETELIEHILDEEKLIFIKITPFYRCLNCKEEYYVNLK